MTDAELNLAIHQEVEGWRWVGKPGHGHCWERDDTGAGASAAKIAIDPYVPDYSIDPAWCVQMLEKSKLVATHRVGHGVLWAIYDKYGEGLVTNEESLTRAVALAVLELHRRKDLSGRPAPQAKAPTFLGR